MGFDTESSYAFFWLPMLIILISPRSEKEANTEPENMDHYRISISQRAREDPHEKKMTRCTQIAVVFLGGRVQKGMDDECENTL
jgi:hypothetical protein